MDNFGNEGNNSELEENYKQTIIEITDIQKEFATDYNNGDPGVDHLLYTISNIILKAAEYEKKMSFSYVRETPLDQLQLENTAFYQELFSENYEGSYANPSYCHGVFGPEYGPLYCYFCNK